jgi:hypothetical protein
MNIFQKIMQDQGKLERSLGNPLRDPAAIERRLNVMATMTGGKGFPIPPKTSNGKRAAKKAAAIKRAERQLRKEREIGVDPIYTPKGQRLGVASRTAWLKREKAWEQANG